MPLLRYTRAFAIRLIDDGLVTLDMVSATSVTSAAGGGRLEGASHTGVSIRVTPAGRGAFSGERGCHHSPEEPAKDRED